MITFKDYVSLPTNEGTGIDIYNAIKNKKTSTGVKLETMYLEYINALQAVVSIPSQLKPYIEEEGIEFPSKKKLMMLLILPTKSLSN